MNNRIRRLMSIGLVLILLISSTQITMFASEDTEIKESAITENEQVSIENEELIEYADIEEKEPENQEADSHLEVTENEAVQSSLEESVEDERIVETVDKQRAQVFADESLPEHVKEVRTFAELKAADQDNVTTEIIIMNDIEIESVIWPGINKKKKGHVMKYRGITPDVTLTPSTDYEFDSMFLISKDMDVTIENLVLDGKNKVYHVDGSMVGNTNVTIDNVTFKNNGRDKAAVYLHSLMGDLTVKNSKFVSNKDGTNGGAIYFSAYSSDTNNTQRAKIRIENTVFEDNEAYGYGGAIYARAARTRTVGQGYSQENIDIEIKNSEFKQNVSQLRGAITFSGAGSLKIEDSKFEGNRAEGPDKKGFGAAVHTQPSDGYLIDIHINNSTFTDNFSTAYGTLTFTGGGTVKIENSHFENNVGSDGGALHTESSPLKKMDVVVDNVTFVGNSADGSTGFSGYGGAIRYHGAGTIKVLNSRFDNNQAINKQQGGMGGAISIHEARFKDNNPEDNKWITATITDSVFNENRSVEGGALSVYDAVDLTINGDTIFTNNHAIDEGGAIGSYTTERIENVEGFIFITEDPSNTLIDGATFIGNSSGSNFDSGRGGAIYLSNELESPTAIKNSVFEGNSARHGGAISTGIKWVENTGITLDITDSDFKNNESVFGGAIKLERRTDLVINGSNFNKNKAKSEGGALMSAVSRLNSSDSIEGKIVINNSTMDGNSSIHGGAIMLDSTRPANTSVKDLEITKSQITNNKASGSGGGIYNYVEKSKVSIDDVLFENNEADYEGGAILIDNEFKKIENLANTVITNSIFRLNKAGTNGGGINIIDSGRKFTDDTDRNVRYYEELEVSDTTFEENTAGNGVFRLNTNVNPRINDVYSKNIKALKSLSLPHTLDKNIAYNNYDISFLSNDISGEKTWDHGSNLVENQPSEITIILYADGKEVDRKVVTNATDWKYDFTGHDIFTESGQRIEYTVDEVDIDDYTKEINNLDIRNTYVKPVLNIESDKTDNLEIPKVTTGDEFEYYITIKNRGDRDVENVLVRDIVPSQLTILNVNLKGLTVQGQLVEGIVPLIKSGESFTITIKVAVNETAKDGDILRNIAVVNDVDVPSRDIVVEVPAKPILPSTGIGTNYYGAIIVALGLSILTIRNLKRKKKFIA